MTTIPVAGEINEEYFKSKILGASIALQELAKFVAGCDVTDTIEIMRDFAVVLGQMERMKIVLVLLENQLIQWRQSRLIAKEIDKETCS